MNRSHCLSVVFAAASLLLGGCSAESSDDAAEPTQDELRIKPKGIDDGSGRVIVQGVAGIAKADVFLGERGARGTSDAPIDFVMSAPTVHTTYSFVSTQGRLKASASGGVDVNRGQASTVKLAGLKVAFGADLSLGLVRGQNVVSELSRDGGRDLELSVDLPLAAADTGDAVLVNPKQKVLLRWGLFDGQSFTTAAEGHTSTFNVQAAAGRMRARIVAAARELPNGCTIMRDEVSVSGGGRTMTYAGVQSMTIGVNPDVVALESRTANGGAMTYRLPCMKYDIELPVGSLGGAVRQIKLGRLDVDHVDVTTPSGAVEAREGTFSIENDNMFEGQTFKTGTGVDVPPGTYRITVAYPANSGWKQFTQTVTVP